MEKNNYFLIKSLTALMVIAFILAAVSFTDNDARGIRQINLSDVLQNDIRDVVQKNYVHMESDHKNKIKISEPVDFDFEEILERGTIRVITRYNVGSYFLRGGLDRGFEFEFFATFARQHDLRVEVIVLQAHEDPIDVLNSGDGDVIAANFINTSLRSERIFFSEPYNLIDQHIILPQGKENVTSLDDLGKITISVPKKSAHLETLMDLQREGYAFKIDIVYEAADTETMMVGVANGRFEATVVDDHQFNIINTYVDGVHLGPKLSTRLPVSWGVRKNAVQLQKEVDKYVYGNFKYDSEEDKIWKSQYMTILHNRYFTNQSNIAQNRRDIHELMYYGLLSPYDNLIRPEADSVGVDWKLVVAVMAQESAFRPNAISFAGAVGLMQIIPRFSKVPNESELMDPQTNIREGLRYLDKHLNHYSYLDPESQLAFTLASYNAGMGHVADARRLAIDANKDPNDWDAVAEGLLKLMDSRYYRHARYGYCRGTETIDYVQRVMSRYKTYQAIADFANSTNRENIEESILAMKKIVAH